MTLNFTINDHFASYDGDPQCSDINTKYATPLLYDLEKGDIDPTDSERAVEKISKLLTDCSASPVENNKKKQT